MKEELINKAYEIAKERYAAVGVDTEKVMETMQNFHLSLHCWQADDVTGFEVQAGSLTGGIQATGNYPGKARNIDELRADILKAASYIPGTHRLNLHEIYGDFQGKVVDRDEVEPEHFKSWIEWGKENNMKLDFNSTSFSHPKSGDLSLSNPDEGIRNFWIEHTKRCRAVAEEMGKAQGDPCIMNLWVHDGSKDITVNRMKYRALLKDSLDQIFATEYKNMKDCIESKVFGPPDRKCCRQSFFFIVVCSRTDAARKSPRTLGLRPRNHHGRPDYGFVQRNRSLQRLGSCTLWT